MQKKADKLLLFLLAFGAIYYYFIAPKTLGHDVRYSIYIFGLPTLIGLVSIGIYARLFLIREFSTHKEIGSRIFMAFMYLLQGIFFSYFSFGQAAKMGFDFLNDNVASKNKIETVECVVDNFSYGKNPSIEFHFNGHYERLEVAYSFIAPHKNENPNHYSVRLILKKGLWNYYRIQSWSLLQKDI